MIVSTKRASRLAAVGAAAWLGALAAAAASAGPPAFTNVTTSAGLAFQSPASAHAMSGGVAAGDVNGDGWADLFFPVFGQADRLYLNNQSGGFVDASGASGFATAINSSGAAFGDIDNDNDLDLYVTTIGDGRNRLYVNDGSGVFVEQAIQRGAAIDRPTDAPWAFGATFGDYDNDGWIDLYTTEWGPEGTPASGSTSARLLRNVGNGFFQDVTVAAGVAVESGPPAPLTPSRTGVYGFSPWMSDLDGDGHVDLAIASDFGNSRLFWNNGDGTFTDGTATAGIGGDENGMGAAIADYDGDGRLDWFVTSIYDTQDTCAGGNCNWGYSGNRLYRNNGDRTFTDATDAAGVRDGSWGWGAAFFDADNDGDRDLAMTNGIDFGSGTEAAFVADSSVFWTNVGDGAFVETSVASGVTDNGLGKGLVTLDYDQDGDQDVVIMNTVGEPVLYRNDTANAGDWLRITLEGVKSNRQGLGSVVTLVDDGVVQVAHLDAGSNYLGTSEPVMHFGFGSTDGYVDAVAVHWPASGATSVVRNVPVNAELTLVEGRLGDLNGDGAVDAADYTTWRDHVGILKPDDYDKWVFAFDGSRTRQSIPEPTTATLAAALLLLAGRASGRRASDRSTSGAVAVTSRLGRSDEDRP